MSKEEELNYLRNMVRILSNRLVYSTKPYDLTINDRQEVIKSLKELKAILEEYKEPVKIELKEKTLGKRKK